MDHIEEVFEMTLMSLVVTVAVVVFASPARAQPPVGALAVDGRQGDQWGLAVDHETAAAAGAAALRECGAGCSVVLTFDRCGAYAADQENPSTAFAWAEARAWRPDAAPAVQTACSGADAARDARWPSVVCAAVQHAWYG